MQMTPILGLTATALLLGACVSAETTIIGKPRTPRAQNCEVKVEPNVPDYPVDTIATTKVMCAPAVGRSGCITRLKEEACKVGGDIVFGFREGAEGSAAVITASLGRTQTVTSGSAPVAATVPAPPPSGADCSPPCSPGYQCSASVCQALCNPPCSPGYACAADRTCQTTTAPAAGQGAPQSL